MGCTLRSAPFGVVGLKCGSGGRRIPRRFLISVGAAHWAARGFQVLHTFLQPCRGDPCGCPPVGGTARPGGRARQREGTSQAARRGRRALQRGRSLNGGGGKSPPCGLQESLSGLGRGDPWGSRRQWSRYRWLGEPRRGSGTAATAIFARPGPSGPAGI